MLNPAEEIPVLFAASVCILMLKRYNNPPKLMSFSFLAISPPCLLNQSPVYHLEYQQLRQKKRKREKLKWKKNRARYPYCLNIELESQNNLCHHVEERRGEKTSYFNHIVQFSEDDKTWYNKQTYDLEEKFAPLLLTEICAYFAIMDLSDGYSVFPLTPPTIWRSCCM